MASLLDNGGVGRARPTRAHQHRIAELCQITYYGAIALARNLDHPVEVEGFLQIYFFGCARSVRLSYDVNLRV
jgi:hypothetical protein